MGLKMSYKHLRELLGVSVWLGLCLLFVFAITEDGSSAFRSADLNELTLAAVICSKMRGNFVQLAMHKYSSNVVEKCALWAGGERASLVDELFFTPGALPLLLQDSYANYVIQTALQSAHPRDKPRLVQVIRAVFVAVVISSPVCISFITACA
jgi:hypothetical protein